MFGSLASRFARDDLFSSSMDSLMIGGDLVETMSVPA